MNKKHSRAPIYKQTKIQTENLQKRKYTWSVNKIMRDLISLVIKEA